MLRKIRVILVDDHVLFLEGLRSLLEHTGDIEVVCVANDGRELLVLLEHQTADVVVLDLHMPYDGLTTLREIRCRAWPIRVLVLTAFGEGENIRSAMKLGAEGFALKTETFSQIIEVIRQVAQGRLVFPQAAQRWLVGKHDEMDQLSPRELEVLSHVARGLTNFEIATALNLSKNTVGFHLKNIFDKLNVSNRTEAAMWYFSHNSSFT